MSGSFVWIQKSYSEVAQELDDKVIKDHIGLYVNPFSLDLGAEGVAAVREFLGRGRKLGVFPSQSSELPLTSNEL